MYVLDEPTIGLHPRDTDRLIKTLKRLRDLGNTVILVEHDLETIRAADHIIDIGPGAGHYGIGYRKRKSSSDFITKEHTHRTLSQRRR